MNEDYIRRLPFEKRIQLSIDAYSLIYPTRLSVMDHYFATNGNGMHWSSGVLMAPDIAESYTRRLPADYELVLPPDGKAARTDKSIDYYLDYEQADHGFARDFAWNQEAMSEMDLVGLARVWPQEAADYANRYPLTLEGIRAQHKKSIIERFNEFHPYPLCQYASMFHIEPVEMRRDWARGLLEYITLREVDLAANPDNYEDEEFYYWKMKDLQAKLVKLLGEESKS